jgi:hypothetical protein
MLTRLLKRANARGSDCVLSGCRTLCSSVFVRVSLQDESTWDDMRGIIAMHDDYATAEPFIKWDYDLRIQKIGALRRRAALFARCGPLTLCRRSVSCRAWRAVLLLESLFLVYVVVCFCSQDRTIALLSASARTGQL